MVKSKELMGVNERIENILKITNNYNYEDLVKAIFCINICINNRSALSSQMTLNLSIVEYKQSGNLRINTYKEFEKFFYKIEKILKISNFDDYIVEDFGEVRFKYKDIYYKVIIGTGHNQVYGELFFLEYLAQKLKKENELKKVFEYNSSIIDFFEQFNVSDKKGEKRFEIPSEALFYKTQEFFNTKIKEIDLNEISELIKDEEAPIEKRYFSENNGIVYPLYNTAILVDLFNIWYKKLKKEEITMVADMTINKILSDITILDQGINPNVLFPVSLFENGSIKSNYIYSFVINCDDGAIIGINKDQFINQEELDKEINLIKQYHEMDNLTLLEVIKRNSNTDNLGVTISKQCDIRFVIYDSFINISQCHIDLTERDKKYYECTALDLIYMLLFMDDQNELFEYVSDKNEEDYEQLFGFGGDCSRFLMWKDSGHMMVKGAIKYGIIDIGYNEENDYVLEYFKTTLNDFPFDCKEGYLLRNHFIWNIKKFEDGNIQYVNKIKKNFGGNIVNLENGAVAFFVHNLDFYNKKELKEDFFEQIHLIDDLNLRKIKRIADVLGKSDSLRNKLIEVMFIPNNYAEKVKLKKENDREYVYSDAYKADNIINIRFTVNYDKLQKAILESKDRRVENKYFEELFKPLNNWYKEEYMEICEKLEKENNQKKEVDVFAIEIDYIYNSSLELYNVKEIDYLNAKKKISQICLESEIEPGEYWGKEANKVIRKMQKKLIENFENRIIQFSREDMHIKLLELCANTYNEINVHRERFNAFDDIDEIVLNEVQLKTIQDREKQKHNLRVILYLLESNLFLERNVEKQIKREELNELLAFSNWLVVLNDNADICYFTDNEAHINVNFDYVVDTLVENNDGKNAEEFSKRVYNDNTYLIKGDEIDKEYVENTKNSFEQDTGIKLIDLFDVCSYFQRYAIEEQKCIKLSDNVYSIKEENLINDIQKCIEKNSNVLLSKEKIEKAIEFLIIDISKLKMIENKTDYYLPIGERRKRENRFDIKPLLNENKVIIFSPVIISYVQSQWRNGLLDNYLPYEIGLENTVNSLIEWKRRYEREMVLDIQQIFKDKDVSFVRTNVELHKIDKKGMHPIDLGDYDVLAIDDSRLKIWIVESKVLKKVGSFFEMYNQQRGFFLDHKEDEKFQRRIDYMKNNYKKILKALKFDSCNDYEIIPYMVMNKVMESRYKKVDFPIISIGELKEEIDKESIN